MSRNTNVFHSPDCPCITEHRYGDQLLFNAVNSNSSLCDLSSRLVKGHPHLDDQNDLICPPPIDFGLSCKKHDLEANKKCRDYIPGISPAYCDSAWCYVDKEICFASNNTFFQDEVFPHLYYSYTTCGYDTPVGKKTDALNGAEIHVVIPEYQFPYFFQKLDDSIYPEYDYTDFQGAIIEYLDIIRTKTSIKKFNYKFPSAGSIRNGLSNYSAAVVDVNNGLADLGGGGFWTTSERFKKTPFTIPIHSSKLYLFELQKEEDSLLYSMQKAFRPFTAFLWLVVVISIFTTAFTAMFTANKRSHSEWHRLWHRDNIMSSTIPHAINTFRVKGDAAIRRFLDFFGNGTQLQPRSTIAHKLLLFGFGFFILVVGSSYVANLATFLTVKNLTTYVSSMDEAMEKDLKICAHYLLEEAINARWNHTKNVKLIQADKEDLYISRAIDDMKKGICDVSIIGETILDLVGPEIKQEVCRNGLVSIKAPVLSMDWAMPVNPKYLLEFSKAISDLEYNGIEFIDILNTYSTPFECEIYPESIIENVPLSVLHMSLPLMLLSFCIVIGISFKLIVRRKSHKKRGAGKREHIVPFTKPKDPKDLSNGAYKDSLAGFTDTHNASLDALELKFRLKLISLNLQRLEKNVTRFMEDEHYDNWETAFS